MHGCDSGSALLVNAEVDSMGGIVDGGVGIGTKTSPRQAAIEKAQAELRLEYDFLEERRRELEFLEKGGNPLDFKIGHAASVSVQSTSLTDQHPEQFVISEAKGSFALTASPRGDSVESSGRPGLPICEPHSADNLMLFDGENEFLEGERNSVHPSRSNIAPSEQSSQLDESLNAKESGDSAAFGLPRKAYRRRNRSRPNRDGARSSSTGVVPSHGGPGSSDPSCHCPKDATRLLLDVDNLKNFNISSNCNSKPTSPNDNMVLKAPPSDSPLDMEMDGLRTVASTTGIKGCLPDVGSDANASKNLQDNESDRLSQFEDRELPINVAGEPTSVGEREQVVSTGFECPPCIATEKAKDEAVAGQMNDFSCANGDTKSIPKEQNISAAFRTKGLDSESSRTQPSLSTGGNNDNERCTDLRNFDSNGDAKLQILASGGSQHIEGNELVNENNDNQGDDSCALTKDDCHPSHLSQQGSGSLLKAQEEINGSCSVLQDEVKNPTATKGMELDGLTAIETERKPGDMVGGSSNPQNENACTSTLPGFVDSSIRELPGPTSSAGGFAVALDQETWSGTRLKLGSKAQEDSILEEARVIQAKRKRIAELSVGTLPLENRIKSHWDFVLEEMAWLANDFAQERLWKMTTAAQICHQVAFTSRLRFKEQNSLRKKKKVALTLANAVIEFWHSVEEKSKELEQCPEKASALAVQLYAVRFLKFNSSYISQAQAEAPTTPDRISDLGILDFSWEDHLAEENLFYTVPPGAMESYRKSIESHLLQLEKNGINMKEEVETSGYDAVADLRSQENAYEEDEGETSTYNLPGTEASKLTKFAQKKRKNLMKSYTARPYEGGADLPFVQCMENKVGTQQSVLMGKRPANSLNVSFPTKRVRTASRQRILGPFSFGTSGYVSAPNKTDASSGDTNSFQDDQSTLHGSQIPNSLEFESVGEFEKQVPFDSTEVSTKPKKKKKAKRLGLTYEQRWQLDSNFQTDQRDHSKRRLEQLESNGTNGLFGQHIMKKPKMMRQSLDNSLDNHTTISGSIPSPVASQMSNMPNPNKFIKMLGGKDCGRKAKALKMSAGQPGSGSPWSSFEDQALVVLVHDLGPNWELVSDAINSTLQFKCIFRQPKECKERHKILMDGTAGDGADSADDSGSSQPYPSTLPGIPKGSARQLFQHLKGPKEEGTLKSHFEKIIMIGQKLHYWRTQNGSQDPKQIQQPHSSHTLALSQACPNNLNGGPVVTPLELCDATASSPDVSFGCQGPHTGGLAISNQNTVPSMLPASAANSTLQASSNMVLGSNFSSPSGPPNAAVRDGRYGIPRNASLSIDEQQRMQQYNQIISGRNIQQSSLSVPGSHDRGVRSLPGGSSMGVMCGLNRSLPMARPGFQGIASSSMLNSGSMLSSGMVAMPSSVNVHSGAGSGQGNSMLRPRDALHMMRPGQNPEHQRQMTVPEVQMHVSQGSSQVVPPFGGLSSSFSNQSIPPSVQSFPPHHQQAHSMSQQQSNVLTNSHHSPLQGPNHVTNTQHQAYAIHIAKERHLQQRLLQQQQQQHQQLSSGALMPHVRAQAQLPISSALQNSSPISSQTIPSPVSMSPLTSSSSMTPISQQPQKHHMPPHGLGRNSQTGGSAVANQMGKQRRHPQQQFQQSGRHHPQQRQQSHTQQQAKLLKGGNVMMHQNLPIDPTLLNGLSPTTGSQSAEKGELVMPLMQGQGLYSGAGVNSVQPPKQLVPSNTSNQSQPQQKMYSGQATPSPKQFHQMPSHSDNSNSGHVSLVASGPALSVAHQTVPPLAMASSNHLQLQSQSQPQQHPQPHRKLMNQTQSAVQRVNQHNRQVNSDPPSKLQLREAQADQHTVNSSSQMCSTPLPQASIDATNVVPVVSSASTPQWKASEPLYDSGMQATQLGSAGTPPLTNCSVTEPTLPISQGLGQRLSSGSLPPLGHDIGAQWQQQLSKIQPSPTSPPQQQQKPSPHQHPPPENLSQQQMQLLQSGNSILYVRPTNSRLE